MNAKAHCSMADRGKKDVLVDLVRSLTPSYVLQIGSAAHATRIFLRHPADAGDRQIAWSEYARRKQLWML